MKSLDIYNKYYSLDKEELSVIEPLPDIINENIELFILPVLSFFESEDDLKYFFKIEKNVEQFKKNFTDWINRLFSPPFDKEYIKFIEKIGTVHANNNINPHYMNVGIGLIRHTLTGLIKDYYPNVEDRIKIINIANKILDFNLDIINTQTRKRDLENRFFKVKVENKLLSFAEHVSHFLNIIIVIMLVLMSGAILTFFIKDFIMIFNGKIEEGIITTLGTMLILWMMIELIEVEIKNLKTKTINIGIFISVVLVAFVRKILIATFEEPKVEKQIFLVGTVLVLALVQYLIYKSKDE